jgi:Uma2 family endonuclease
MQQQHKRYFTPQEYLEIERQAESKAEYWNGEVYAMAGASRTHNLILTNAVASIGAKLKGRPCELYANDMRVKVSATGLYTYPDIVIACGPLRFEDQHEDTLLNPTALIEILSKSTTAYDRVAKFDHYRALESVTDYVLISQDRAFVEHRVRHSADRWLLSFYMGLDTVVPMPSLGCELPMADIYDKIEWKDEDAARGMLRAIKEPQATYTVSSQTRVQVDL